MVKSIWAKKEGKLSVPISGYCQIKVTNMVKTENTKNTENTENTDETRLYYLFPCLQYFPRLSKNPFWTYLESMH